MKKSATKIPTIDRFRIVCETDEQQLGAILAELARRGITTVGYELITDVLHYKKNHEQPAAKNPKRFGITGSDSIIREAKKTNGRFTTKQIKKLFIREGRNINSVYPSCDHLLKRKAIKRIGDGQYQLLASAEKLNGSKERVNG